MVTLKIRRIEDSATMSLPSNVLKMLNIQDGAMLDLYVTKGAFTARPVHTKNFSTSVDRLHGVELEGIAVLSVN